MKKTFTSLIILFHINIFSVLFLFPHVFLFKFLVFILPSSLFSSLYTFHFYQRDSMNLHKTRMSLFYSFSIETKYMSCHRYCKTAESALSPGISCSGSCIYPRSLRSLCPGDSGHSKPCLFPQCLTAFYPHTLYILSQGRQDSFLFVCDISHTCL
jgi:hypothetical protein